MYIRSGLFVLLALPLSLVMAAPEEPGAAAPANAAQTRTEQQLLNQEQRQVEALEQEQVQQQEKVRQQHRLEEDNSATAPEGRQEQRNANTGEAPVRGDDVKEGPYGDKKYGKRHGTPQVSGQQSSPQKKGR